MPRFQSQGDRIDSLTRDEPVGLRRLHVTPPESAGLLGKRVVSSNPLNRGKAKRLRRKAAEDPIAQARRHVAEAEQHIARQEALVAKLAKSDRHAPLTAEAKEILATLEHTLSLALQHLEIEWKR